MKKENKECKIILENEYFKKKNKYFNDFVYDINPKREKETNHFEEYQKTNCQSYVNNIKNN